MHRTIALQAEKVDENDDACMLRSSVGVRFVPAFLSLMYCMDKHI